jgi:hypothetical protein
MTKGRKSLRTANALARSRAVVFLAQQPYTPVASPQPGWQPEASVSPEEVLPPPVLDLSQPPQVLWAPGRSSVQNPPRKRARLQGPTGLMSSSRSSTSFSAPATPKADLSSFMMSPTPAQTTYSPSQSELQGNGNWAESPVSPCPKFRTGFWASLIQGSEYESGQHVELPDWVREGGARPIFRRNGRWKTRRTTGTVSLVHV